MNDRPKLVIGFITYGKSTSKYLPYFLSSLKIQSYSDFKVIAIDNSLEENNENKKFIDNQEWLDIDLEWAGGNIGFSRAYNKMLRKAVEMDVEYFLVVNPDVIMDDDMINELIKSIESDGELGSVSPKVLKWDYDVAMEKDGDPLSLIAKTNIIDSCGIVLKNGLRFVDIGQGDLDFGQYDNDVILGPSGSCALFKIDALKKIAINKSKVDENGNIQKKQEYFDELMFMYKEDCDLVYRLFLSGYKSKVVGRAKMYHDRTAFGVGEGNINIAKARKFKSKQVKKWGFLNQHIIFYKYWKLQDWKNKLAILWFEFRAFIFIIFFEWHLFKVYKEIWDIRSKIKKYEKND